MKKAKILQIAVMIFVIAIIGTVWGYSPITDYLERDANNVPIQDSPIFKQRFDYNSTTNPVWVGVSEPNTDDDDSNWQIRQLSWDGNNNVLTTDYADGDAKFDNIWENRSNNYTYG